MLKLGFKSFFEKIWDALGECEIDFYVRIFLLKAKESRDYMMLSEARHRVNLQRPRRADQGITRLRLCEIDLRQNLLAGFQIAAACLGQCELARGPVQKSGAQTRLQVTY